MAYLSDSLHIRLVGGLAELTTDDGITDAKLRSQMAAAARQLKSWVSISTYAAALVIIDLARDGDADKDLESDPSILRAKCSTDEEYEQVSALRYAEAALTMYHALPSLNMNTIGGGIHQSVITEKGQSNQLSPQQLRDNQALFLKMANDAAFDYQTAGMGVTFVETDITSEDSDTDYL